MMNLPHWQLFLSIGVLLTAAEIFVPGFVVLPIGIGFILTAGVAALTDHLVIQLLALAFFEVLTFFVFTKFLRRYLGTTNLYTNAEGMVGKQVEVIETIGKHTPGYVKLYGDRWLAQCDLDETLEKGTQVVIIATSGNRVIVEPING